MPHRNLACFCCRLKTDARCLTGWKRAPRRSLGVLCLLSAIGLVASSSLIPALRAQTLPDDVHLSPRGQTDEARSSEDPSSKARGKPIKVDVNLVLLAVTITDVLNRPVTGLEKDNFKVFERKEPQDIRHFSGEDTRFH